MRHDSNKKTSKLRDTGKAGVIGTLLLAGTVGLGPAAAAQNTELGARFESGSIAGMERGVSLLAQAEGTFGEFAGDDDVFDANDEGFLSEDVDGDGTNEIGVDEDASGTLDENEVLGSDENNDQALTEDEFTAGASAEADVGGSPVADVGATPATDTLGVFGDDERFDANDKGFLREDLNNDGTFEIGFDEDQSGTLEENEVLGTDADNDEGLGAPLSDGATAGTEDAMGTDDFTTAAGDDGIFDANDAGYLSGDVDGDGTNEIGFDEDESGTLEENEVLGSDLDNDQALTNEITYPFADIAATDAGALNDHGVLDADNEGYLREDIDDDGVWEIGIDEDESGALEENEVYGSDLNNDQALTNEVNTGTGADDATSGAPTVDFANYAGDDNTFDANDEGYLSEDVDGDGTNEIGVDEDESGTLDENEVLGTNANNDEALSEDEVGV